LTAVTSDGWTISVAHYAPARVDKGRLPVILCHGLSLNGVFWDVAPEVSLAKYLQQAGYDVYVPSLRGAGWSTKPPVSRLRQLFRGDLYTAGGFFTAGGNGVLKLNWTVDDHVRYDVPTILDLVTRTAGAKQAHWIGHSMGGMIMVAYLHAHPDEPKVASFVAVATPVFITKPLSKPMEQLAKGRGAVEITNVMVSTNLPAILGQIAGTGLPTPIDVLFYNRANADDDTMRRLSNAGTEDISPGQLGQLIDMVSGGKFTSADGKTDYTDNLERLQTPSFFLAGTVDNLATVDAVKMLYNRWGAHEKRFALYGVVNGQKIDYGHDDLIVGKNSLREVYPDIRRWLESRQPAESLLSPLLKN
jgi:pimeloyl-ACP methyl ester carboxylesterase